MNEVKTAVILAAGLGSRLKDRTKEKPKAFLTIDGKTLIERSINNLLNHGISKIIIGTGYLSEHFDALIKKYPMIETCRNDDYAQTGSMYTLYNMRHLIKEPFLLLEADLLYEIRAISLLIDNTEKSIILASGKTNSNDEVYIEANDKSYLVNMSKSSEDLHHISGELVGISKVSVDTFEKMCDYANIQYQENNYGIHYEDDFVGISPDFAPYILKEEHLVWCEIDDENHLNRAINEVYPKIMQRDKV